VNAPQVYIHFSRRSTSVLHIYFDTIILRNPTNSVKAGFRHR